MKSLLYTSDSRGKADYDWLKTHYSFSFAEYYHPDRMGFGSLRVLNDDSIAGGKGFGAHPHQNMEIITIPLSGGLEHKDNLGNTAVSQPGDIQAMSAGSGVFHSEYNASKDQEVRLLQIWVLPNQLGVIPRYEQRSFDTNGVKNVFHQIISPMNSGEEGLGIYQQAWFQRCVIEKDYSLSYQLKDQASGVYLFLISGSIQVNEIDLNTRDAVGLWDIENSIDIHAIEESECLVMEVPMIGG